VDRAIAADPQQRYATVGALLDALGEIGAPPDRVSLVRRAVTAAVTIAVLVAIFFVSGILTSRHFNMVLERSDFTEETAMNWLVWGAQAGLGPVGMALIGGIFAALGAVCPARRLKS